MQKKRALCACLVALLLCSSFTACNTAQFIPPASTTSTTSKISPAIVKDASSQPETEKPLADFTAAALWEGRNPTALCRGWYNGTVVGAYYDDRYLFLEDGTFYFTVGGQDGTQRQKYLDGDWYYEDETLYLTAKRTIVLEGGIELEGAYGSQDRIIQDGEYVKYELAPEEYIHMELPVHITQRDELGDWPWREDCISITMGNQQFWSGLVPDFTSWNSFVDFDDMLSLWDEEDYSQLW